MWFLGYLSFWGTYTCNWECQTCYCDKFAFSQCDDTELLMHSFNSNFNCKCKTDTLYLKNNETHRFRYTDHPASNEKNYYSGPDSDNGMEDAFKLSLKFGYHNAHDFHKLISNKQKSFGVLHTNICSLQHNFDNLQQLICHLCRYCGRRP